MDAVGLKLRFRIMILGLWRVGSVMFENLDANSGNLWLALKVKKRELWSNSMSDSKWLISQEFQQYRKPGFNHIDLSAFMELSTTFKMEY